MCFGIGTLRFNKSDINDAENITALVGHCSPVSGIQVNQFLSCSMHCNSQVLHWGPEQLIPNGCICSNNDVFLHALLKHLSLMSYQLGLIHSPNIGRVDYYTAVTASLQPQLFETN